MAELRLEVDLLHPRGRVWRALTEPELLGTWFQPIDEHGRVRPTSELPGFEAFDLEVVEAEAPERLTWRWHGLDFSSDVHWELAPEAAGCRLRVRQTGFLGSHEVSRRKALFDGYPSMFDRLKVLLDRMASGEPAVESLEPEPEPLPAERRLKLLSLAGAVVLVVLCGAAGAVWINQGSSKPIEEQRRYGLGTGSQPGIGPLPPSSSSPSASRSPSPSPSPAGPHVSTEPLTATYKTVALLGLGGFDTEVTVRGVGHSTWTVVLTMPDSTKVENRSESVVKMVQDGAIVTLTPLGDVLPVTFVIRFPALLALGKSIKSCTIDGQACAAR